jgi:hypothetical protein
LLVRCIQQPHHHHQQQRHAKKKNMARQLGGLENRGKRRREDGQPRRPENRVPRGPSALRAYVPARMATAEAAPSASWAFFCAVDAAFSPEGGDDEVEARRRGALVRSMLRSVVERIFLFCVYNRSSLFFGL